MSKVVLVLFLLFSSLSKAQVNCDVIVAKAAQAKALAMWADPSEGIDIGPVTYLGNISIMGASYRTFHVLLGDSAGVQLWHVMTPDNQCRVTNVQLIKSF